MDPWHGQGRAEGRVPAAKQWRKPGETKSEGLFIDSGTMHPALLPAHAGTLSVSDRKGASFTVQFTGRKFGASSSGSPN